MNLTAERKLKGLTQERAANEIGVTPRHYQAIEAGASGGSMRLWRRLSALLGKPIDWLARQGSGRE